MSIELRPRARLVLGCAAVFGCLLIPARHTTPLALAWVSIVAPVQKVMARGGRLLAFTLDDLLSWRSAAKANRRLTQKIAELKEQLEDERARSAAKDRDLKMLGDFVLHRQGLHWYGAEVIGEGAGAQRGLIFIGRGSAGNVEERMVVVAGHSIVGTVRAVAPSVSSVLLENMQGSRLDGQIVTTGERGIVVGNGDGTMRMKYVAREKPERGAGVVARGKDGVTPKHFLLGIIARAERRPGSLIYDVVLKPARDLDRLVSVVAVKPVVSAADFPK